MLNGRHRLEAKTKPNKRGGDTYLIPTVRVRTPQKQNLGALNVSILTCKVKRCVSHL